MSDSDDKDRLIAQLAQAGLSKEEIANTVERYAYPVRFITGIGAAELTADEIASLARAGVMVFPNEPVKIVPVCGARHPRVPEIRCLVHPGHGPFTIGDTGTVYDHGNEPRDTFWVESPAATLLREVGLEPVPVKALCQHASHDGRYRCELSEGHPSSQWMWGGRHWDHKAHLDDGTPIYWNDDPVTEPDRSL